MSPLEILLAAAYVIWLAVCVVTATLKGRSMAWGVLASLLPPLYLVLLWLRPVEGKAPPRERCPLCRMGWVVIDRRPWVCSGCGKEVTWSQLQGEMHRDMM